ncbi:MAG: DUF3419 family protein, partial [Verrucomicrobium sp.]
MKLPSTLPEADTWATEAASWPLAFAQVREDPRIDVEVLKLLPGKPEVVMIASGGETAVTLEAQGLGRLTLVDMNPAQLALTKLKRHLAQNYSPPFTAVLLGHGTMVAGARQVALCSLLETLELDRGVFGPIEGVAASGPDHIGRYEILFAELWKELSTDQETLQMLLMADQIKDAPAMLEADSPAGKLLDQALAQVMSLQNLVCLFGEEATRHPRQPFDRHFAQRIRHAIGNLPASTNPFLWQMLAGLFPARNRYDWLQTRPRDFHADWLPADKVHFLNGKMLEVLETLPKESADMVHLSNIL